MVCVASSKQERALWPTFDFYCYTPKVGLLTDACKMTFMLLSEEQRSVTHTQLIQRWLSSHLLVSSVDYLVPRSSTSSSR